MVPFTAPELPPSHDGGARSVICELRPGSRRGIWWWRIWWRSNSPYYEREREVAVGEILYYPYVSYFLQVLNCSNLFLRAASASLLPEFGSYLNFAKCCKISNFELGYVARWELPPGETSKLCLCLLPPICIE